jgi:CDP-paratose 2-epimerase
VDWVIDASANPSVTAGIDSFSSSRQVVEHNLIGTCNTLEFCKRFKAGLILLSSSRVYSIKSLNKLHLAHAGNAFKLTPEQNLPAGISVAGVNEKFSTAPPVSLYGSTKHASEVLALEYGECFDFPVLINRCGVMAGAGQFCRGDQGIFSYWIHAWLRNRSLTYSGFDGLGYQVRDCLHPRDLLDLIIKQTTLRLEHPEHVFNVGGGLGNSISLAQLSDWCQSRFGHRTVGGNPATHKYDVPWLVMDSSLAGDIWGWRPRIALNGILLEIAEHAKKHPGWLEISGIE